MKSNFLIKTRFVFTLLAVFSCLVLLLAQGGKVEILKHTEEVFVNNNCKKNKTCDLKKVDYIVEDYKVSIDGDYNYGTRFFARYETESLEDLEKYVFVQFIKGCDFSSRLVNGKVVTEQDVSYPRDKGSIKFRFPNWTIDSYDSDPVYSTVSGESRLFAYRWNTVLGSFSTETEKLYGMEKPTTPQLYIVDHPGSAFYSNGVAHNISLEFRTCIYRIKDVPWSVAYNNTKFAKPIDCYEWSSSLIYNHGFERFQKINSISKACK